MSAVTTAKAYRLLKAIDQWYRALVLLGTFGSLRWGELAALRRCDIDRDACTIRVDRQLTETLDGGAAFGPPKSDAALRLVPFPEVIAPDVRWHLACFAQDGDDGLIFTSPARFDGRAWQDSNLRPAA